jgi:heme/copper-type cytochrome/quinol oxidase subunit 2
MMEWLESLPVYGSGIIIVGGFVVLTVLVGLAIAKLLPQERRMEHNDLAGFILAVIGVVYAVLLAFVTVTVWERFDGAEARSYVEASDLAAVYRDAGEFAGGAAIRADLREYARLVAGEEWPAMAHGGQSEKADALIERVDRAVRRLPVANLRDEDLHQQMLASVAEALQDRDIRLSMDATGISSVMWLVLMLGAVVTVAFTYLFGYKHESMRLVMSGSLGLLIGLVLFLTVALDYPFRGGITVGPEAFLDLQNTFKNIGN